MQVLPRFLNREDAGRRLASLLEKYRSDQPIVLGIARDGIPVAAEVAGALGAPLDVLVVRELSPSGMPQDAIGAIAVGSLRLDTSAVATGRLSADQVSEIVERESRELERRERIYRRGRAPLALKGRTVIVVTDRVATGCSAGAAIESVRRQRPARVIFATPFCTASGATRLGREADEVAYAAIPPPMIPVSLLYEDFTPTSDASVIRALDHTAPRRAVGF